MAIELTLEIETGINHEDIRTVLTLCGAGLKMESNQELEGKFPSGLWFFYRSDLGNRTLLTEDSQGQEWSVGGRMQFRYFSAEFEKCSADVHCFVEHLATATISRFLLSFQYERTYAVRDTSELRFLEKF